MFFQFYFQAQNVYALPNASNLFASYLKDFTDSHGAPKLVEKQAVKIISEPTSVYRLVRRCAYLRRDIAEELRQTPGRPCCY